MVKNNLTLIAAVLSGAVAVVAFLAWGQMNRWQIVGMSTYELFPLFGLLAFSLLWSQYVAAAAAKYFNAETLGKYFEVTGYIVLGAIFMHPGLLVWQLWRDGFGLPPGSYLENYVAPGLGWAALLGTMSLFVFASYELRRVLKSERWKRWLSYASDGAMIAIVVHSLKLGGELQAGWLRWVWLFYAATFAACLLYLRFWAWLEKRAKTSG